jgi:hypothetical protein
MIDKFLRGDAKLFQGLFSLPPIIIVALVIVITLIPLQQIPTSSISLLLLSMSTQSAFAYHGQEIILSLDNSTFFPLTTGTGNQIRVLANYNIQNSSIVGQTINAVMKLYALNGTLIKSSSYPSGFVVQNTNGTAELKTNVDPAIQRVMANITLTNAAKTEVISNEISTTISPQGASLTPTTNTTAITPEEETNEQPSQVQESPPLLQQPLSSQPSQQEEIQGEEHVPQTTPSPEAEAPGIVPPFG